MSYAHLTPAFGRVYKSRAEVKKELQGYRDFVITSGLQAKYINLDGLVDLGLSAQVRYGVNLTKVTSFTANELAKMRESSTRPYYDPS